MPSFNPLLVLIFSLVALVASGPLHPDTHSLPLAKNSISSRQFRYPRALFGVCAEVNLSLIVKDVAGLRIPGSLLGDICLCLSAFPLDLHASADLELLTRVLGQTKVDVEALLENYVEENGTQCTYPEYSSPQCAFGNACDFTCTDGFVKNGASCVCPSPKSICNGKCGVYPKGCSSALPRAPKMTRSSISSSNRVAS